MLAAWVARYSIVQRLTALAVALSVFALVVNSLLFASAISPMLDDLADTLAAQANATRLAMQHASPAQRAPLAKALSRIGMQVLPGLPPHAQVAADDDHDPFLTRMRGLLGPGVTLAFGEPDARVGKQQMLASFEVDGSVWRIEFAPPRGSPRDPLWSMLGGLVLLALIGLLVMMTGIQLIARPMARLAAAVSDRHDRLRPLDMSLAAGTELQQVVGSFNGLVAAVVAAEESRRNMLAGVSHDLRTPLARVRLRAEMECSNKTAGAIESDCNAMDRIIGQFLAYAQGEAGVSLGVREPLAELVRHVAGFYDERDVALELDDAAASTLSYPDLAIQRLLTNLIDNALAHGQRPVRVEVRVDAALCRLMVHDAGAGICEAEMARAVKPFVTLAGPERDGGAKLGHCGLGLAIVGQICRELGGVVVHQPFDGFGSAIGVALPRGAG